MRERALRRAGRAQLRFETWILCRPTKIARNPACAARTRAPSGVSSTTTIAVGEPHCGAIVGGLGACANRAKLERLTCATPSAPYMHLTWLNERFGQLEARLVASSLCGSIRLAQALCVSFAHRSRCFPKRSDQPTRCSTRAPSLAPCRVTRVEPRLRLRVYDIEMLLARCKAPHAVFRMCSFRGFMCAHQESASVCAAWMYHGSPLPSGTDNSTLAATLVCNHTVPRANTTAFNWLHARSAHGLVV